MTGEQVAQPMRVYLALVATVLLWASAFVAIRAAVSELGAGELALARYVVASLVMAAVVVAARPRLPSRHALPRVIVLGVSGIAVYNVALNVGEQSVSAGAASLLVATVPLLTSLFAVVLLRESVGRRLAAGLTCGFAGAALIALGEGDELTLNAGVLQVLVAAIALASYFVLQKPLLQGHGPLAITACAIWAGTIALVPFGGSTVHVLPSASGEALIAAIYLGVFPGALGYVSWAYVLSHMPASRASNYLYGVPVATLVIAWVWLGEVPGMLVIVGGVLALIGVAVGTTPSSVAPRVLRDRVRDNAAWPRRRSGRHGERTAPEDVMTAGDKRGPSPDRHPENPSTHIAGSA